MKKVICVVVLLLMIGCIFKAKKPDYYPDWSTPERATATYLYAGDVKDGEIYFNSLTMARKSSIAKTEAERLVLINKMKEAKKSFIKRDIISISNVNDTEVEVVLLVHPINKNYKTREISVTLTKTGNKWLVDN